MQSEEGENLQQFGTLQTLMPLAAALLKSTEFAADVMPPADEDGEVESEAGWAQ